MWTQQLNRHATYFEIEGSQWSILYWAHREFLPTNVPHRHTYFEACLVGEHGEGIFFNEGQTHDLNPGTFFLARPGAVHQIVNTGTRDMELFWVSFALPRVGNGEIASLLRTFENSSLVLAENQDALSAIWRAVRSLGQKTDLPDALALRHLSQALLLEIAQIGANTRSTQQPEIPVGSPTYSTLAKLGAQYVHDNLERPLTPDEVARHLGVSRRQLTRLFSSYTGIPPALYIGRSRLDHARGLLRAGQKSIKEIAVAVGYRDVHHFTRSFTRVIGTSPAHFRAHGHEAQEKNSGPNIQKPGSLV